MDIVSRIKIFMNYLNIANSQFADSCRIPRPTISQILNGRNKKISDELISKIHETYPSLSVLWLMFGEGEMLIDSNIKTSEPQNDALIDFNDNATSEVEGFMQTLDFSTSPTDPILQKNPDPDISAKEDDNGIFIGKKDITQEPQKTSISFNTDNSKKIVNIMVFYSDNSFESFTPASAKN